MRLFGLGLYYYFSDPFNGIDVAVIVTSVIELSLTGQSFSSAFRALRLLRVLKLLKNFPTLRQVVQVVLNAFAQTAYLVIILGILFFIAALMGMQFFGGRFLAASTPPRWEPIPELFAEYFNENISVLVRVVNNGTLRLVDVTPYNPARRIVYSHFNDLLHSFLTVFQIFSADMWSDVLYTGMKTTSQIGSVVFCVVVLVVGHYVLESLFLAILIAGFSRVATNTPIHHEGEGAEEEPLQQENDDIDDFLAATLTRHNSVAVFVPSMQKKEKEVVVVECAGDAPPLQRMQSEIRILHNQKVQQQKVQAARKNATSQENTPKGEDLNGSTRSSRPPTAPYPAMAACGQGNSKEKTCSVCRGVIAAALPPPPLVRAKDAEQLHKTRYCTFMKMRLDKTKTLDVMAQYLHAHYEVQGSALRLGSSVRDDRLEGALPLLMEEAKASGVLLNLCSLPLSAVLQQLQQQAVGGRDRAPAVFPLDSPQASSINSNSQRGAPTTAWQCLLQRIEEEKLLVNLGVGEEQVGRGSVVIAQAALPQPYVTNGGWSLFIFSPTNPLRIACYVAVHSPIFEDIVLVIITASTLSLILDNPREDQSTPKYAVLDILGYIFTALFALEALMRIIALNFVFHPTAYLKDAWNVLDFAVVIVSILTSAVPRSALTASGSESENLISVMHGLKALRAVRPLRVIQRSRGLRLVIATLMRSMGGIFNVALLSLLYYLIMGIVGVQLLAGKLYRCNDPGVVWQYQCHGEFYNPYKEELQQRMWVKESRNYDNIFASMLTFFEVSAGKLWIAIMYNGVAAVSVDHAMERDYHPALGLMYVVAFAFSNLFMLNLFVAVVIYNFGNISVYSDGLSLVTDEQKLWVETQRLMLNYRPTPQMVAPVLQRMRNGEVAKGQLFQKLRFFCFSIVRRNEFEFFVGFLIVLNIVKLMLYHDGMDESWNSALSIINIVFVWLFTAEMVLKLLGFGWRYFLEGWNRLDCFIVVVSLVDFFLDVFYGTGLPIDLSVLRLLRIFRIIRLMRLIKHAHHVRTLLETLYFSVPSLINISLFLMLIYVVYAIMGMQLFSKVKNGRLLDDYFSNFHSFYNSMKMLFAFMTGEDWNDIMHDCMETKNCGAEMLVGYRNVTKQVLNGTNVSGINITLLGGGMVSYLAPIYVKEDDCGTFLAPVYFVSFMLISAFVIVNLLIAIILENFTISIHMQDSKLDMADLHHFVDCWSAIDPDTTMLIPTHRLPSLLYQLKPPLGISFARSKKELIRKALTYRIPEHQGTVHFAETMIPLARAVSGVALSQREIREHEELWKRSCEGLKELPFVRFRGSVATIYEYFCCTLIAASFRRFKAREAAAALREERRHDVAAALQLRAAHHSSIEGPSMEVQDAE